MLDLTQQLSSFGSSIVDKRFDILLEAVHTFPHLAVEDLSTHEALNEVFMSAEDALIPAHDAVSTLLQGLVFLLIRTYSLVLQEVPEGPCKVFEKGRLFVHRRNEAILV